MVDDRIKKIVLDYVELLRAQGIYLTRVIIFGSHTTENYTIDSDIDVMLISPIFDGFNDDVVAKIWRLTKNFDFKIEPITIGERLFSTDETSPIIATAKQFGTEIAA